MPFHRFGTFKNYIRITVYIFVCYPLLIPESYSIVDDEGADYAWFRMFLSARPEACSVYSNISQTCRVATRAWYSEKVKSGPKQHFTSLQS